MDIFRALHFVNGYICDAIFPPRAHTERIRNQQVTDIRSTPTTHQLLNHEIVTLLDYQDASTRDLIHALKYEHSTHAAQLCAEILADYLLEEIASLRTFSPRPVALVPIPLHKKRLTQRGYNQIERVLDHLPLTFRQETGISLRTDMLVRTRDTPHQTNLPRHERLRNVAGAFAVLEPKKARTLHVFLIDDVSTTGATLVSAGQVLNEAGATITLLSLARA